MKTHIRRLMAMLARPESGFTSSLRNRLLAAVGGVTLVGVLFLEAVSMLGIPPPGPRGRHREIPRPCPGNPGRHR